MAVAEYVLEKGLAGVMTWDVNRDCRYYLKVLIETGRKRGIFPELAQQADSVSKYRCLSVCLSVCPSAPFDAFFLGLSLANTVDMIISQAFH